MSKHMEAAATTQPELFFWERPELDFPLYDDETMGLWQPILLIGSAVAALVSLSFLPDSRMVKSAALFLGPLVPYLIVARGNIFTIIKRPRLGDIILVPVTLILTIAYSLGMGILLYKLGFEIQGNAVYNETRDAVFFASLFVQLFGEEMVKLNIFLGVLILAFKRTGNRKMSVVAAATINALNNRFFITYLKLKFPVVVAQSVKNLERLGPHRCGEPVEILVLASAPLNLGKGAHSRKEHVLEIFVGGDIFCPKIGLDSKDMLLLACRQSLGHRVIAIHFA